MMWYLAEFWYGCIGNSELWGENLKVYVQTTAKSYVGIFSMSSECCLKKNSF